MPMRHSADQIVAKLERAGEMVIKGATISQAAAAIGVAEATYCRWRKNYLALRSDQLRYVKELEVEIQQLRREISELERGPAPPMRADAS